MLAEIILAAGCFWGVQATFDNVNGVRETTVGYIGGNLKNPSYKDVSSGQTGHAEAVKVSFDPNTVSLDEILDVFFISHDPTSLNRQGPDVGTQYRSAIFYNTPEQKKPRKTKSKNMPLISINRSLLRFFPRPTFIRRKNIIKSISKKLGQNATLIKTKKCGRKSSRKNATKLCAKKERKNLTAESMSSLTKTELIVAERADNRCFRQNQNSQHRAVGRDSTDLCRAPSKFKRISATL